MNVASQGQFNIAMSNYDVATSDNILECGLYLDKAFNGLGITESVFEAVKEHSQTQLINFMYKLLRLYKNFQSEFEQQQEQLSRQQQDIQVQARAKVRFEDKCNKLEKQNYKQQIESQQKISLLEKQVLDLKVKNQGLNKQIQSQEKKTKYYNKLPNVYEQEQSQDSQGHQLPQTQTYQICVQDNIKLQYPQNYKCASPNTRSSAMSIRSQDIQDTITKIGNLNKMQDEGVRQRTFQLSTDKFQQQDGCHLKAAISPCFKSSLPCTAKQRKRWDGQNGIECQKQNNRDLIKDAHSEQSSIIFNNSLYETRPSPTVQEREEEQLPSRIVSQSPCIDVRYFSEESTTHEANLQDLQNSAQK